MKYAIIDIGSNSIRYMGADGKKRLATTRLAEGLDETGRLGDDAIRRSMVALSDFVRIAKDEGLEPRAYATSAVRDAVNGGEFVSLAGRGLDLKIDVLTGGREAEYALLGARAEALIDIGGGSSQLVSEGFALSFPMGCVRAKDICSSAKTLDEARTLLEERCRGLYIFPRARFGRWTGVGGTVTTLAALSAGLGEYDAPTVEKEELTYGKVKHIASYLYGLGGERRSVPLLLERHDVIIPGALVLLYIMRGLNINELSVSDADGMEGYLAGLQ